MSTTPARKFGVIGAHPVITATAALVVVAVVVTGLVVRQPRSDAVTAAKHRTSAWAPKDVIVGPFTTPPTTVAENSSVSPTPGGRSVNTGGSGPAPGPSSGSEATLTQTGGTGILNCPDGRSVNIDHTPTLDEIRQLCGVSTGGVSSPYYVECPDGRAIPLDHPATIDEMSQLCGIPTGVTEITTTTTNTTTVTPTSPPAVHLADAYWTVRYGTGLIVIVDYVFKYSDGSSETVTKQVDQSLVPKDGLVHHYSWSYFSTTLGGEISLWIDVTATPGTSPEGYPTVSYGVCPGLSYGF